MKKATQNLSCPHCYSNNMIRKDTTSAGNKKYQCKSCKRITINPLGLHFGDDFVETKSAMSVADDCKKFDRFFITSAQNGTPVFANGLNTVHNYCKQNNAKLVVMPVRYKNPTRPNEQNMDQGDEWFDTSVEQFLTDKRFDLCRGLTVLGDVRVQPTAVNPLTGLETFTGSESCIVASPKKAMQTIPTRNGELAKIMQTTGSITVSNYSNSKAGAKGDNSHNLGGLVVEVDRRRGLFNIRRVSINRDGSFYDLNRKYSGLKIWKNKRPDAVVLGDLHYRFANKTIEKCIESDIFGKLNPRNVVMHDVVDSFAVSHHHAKKPFTNLAKHRAGFGNIFYEIKEFTNKANEWCRLKKSTCFHVVPSNHHEHIQRWIEESNWKTDPENAEFYLETALHLVKNTKMTNAGTDHPDPFEYWLNKLSPKLNIVPEDGSLVISGMELGMHGHIGPNGARGSLKNLAKTGTPVVVGHVHSPGELGDSLAVGVCAPEMEYARGPSGWLSSQAIVYPDGNTTLVNIIEGQFTNML